MPEFKVAKPFKTSNRRFLPGASVTPADLVGSRLEWDDMVDRDFIKSTAPVTSSVAAPRAAAPPEPTHAS